MLKETEEKLAHSLSAESAELLPFLPYLLQDFWELGSDPGVMIELISKHIKLSEDTRVLDLACGKGPVSVKIAQKLKIKVKGVDIIPEFIEFAIQKAKEVNVSHLCEFIVEDINKAVQKERGYDCVIFGSVGNVLGDLRNPVETLNKLKETVKPGGYILIEEGYIPDEGDRQDIRHNGDIYLFKSQWMDSFKEAGLELVETASGHSEGNLDSNSGMAAITARANELIEKHPDKKELFEGYIRSQQNEYDDIDDSLVCVTWMLKKI